MDGPLDKLGHYIISVMVVTKDILTTQQHLNRGFGHMLPDNAQPLPRIFIQKAERAVKCSSSPGFEGKVTDIIQFFQHLNHIGGAHPGGCQRLMSIPQDCFHDFNRGVAHGEASLSSNIYFILHHSRGFCIHLDKIREAGLSPWVTAAFISRPRRVSN